MLKSKLNVLFFSDYTGNTKTTHNKIINLEAKSISSVAKMYDCTYQSYYLGSSMLQKPAASIAGLQIPIRDLYLPFCSEKVKHGLPLNTFTDLRVTQMGMTFAVSKHSETVNVSFDINYIHMVEGIRFCALQGKKGKAMFVPLDFNYGKKLIEMHAFAVEEEHNFMFSLNHPSLLVCVVQRIEGINSLDCHLFCMNSMEEAIEIKRFINETLRNTRSSAPNDAELIQCKPNNVHTGNIYLRGRRGFRENKNESECYAPAKSNTHVCGPIPENDYRTPHSSVRPFNVCFNTYSQCTDNNIVCGQKVCSNLEYQNSRNGQQFNPMYRQAELPEVNKRCHSAHYNEYSQQIIDTEVSQPCLSKRSDNRCSFGNNSSSTLSHVGDSTDSPISDVTCRSSFDSVHINLVKEQEKNNAQIQPQCLMSNKREHKERNLIGKGQHEQSRDSISQQDVPLFSLSNRESRSDNTDDDSHTSQKIHGIGHHHFNGVKVLPSDFMPIDVKLRNRHFDTITENNVAEKSLSNNVWDSKKQNITQDCVFYPAQESCFDAKPNQYMHNWDEIDVESDSCITKEDFNVENEEENISKLSEDTLQSTVIHDVKDQLEQNVGQDSSNIGKRDYEGCHLKSEIYAPVNEPSSIDFFSEKHEQFNTKTNHTMHENADIDVNVREKNDISDMLSNITLQNEASCPIESEKFELFLGYLP